jgi:acetyl/propionyl-CoA carboxylase alpha subunit
VKSPDGLEEALRWAQAQTQAVYGDNLIYLERLISPAHSVTVQVLRDGQGNLVHLGERDGSVQLGNQKLLVEAPAPCLAPEQREQLWQAAVQLARLFDCRNAISVEFLVDQDGRFYFTEIKPRIQTDHAVTEMLSGIDIVREQIRIAAGEPLGYNQADVRLRGWAMQSTISAQDPWNHFLPSPGYLRRCRLPGGPRVRVDTYLYSRCNIPARYDPTIAMVVVWGEDRAECLRRMGRALQDFTIIGVPTDLPFLQTVLATADFVQGRYATSLLERPPAVPPADETYLRDLAVVAAIAFARRNLVFRPTTPERLVSGWHRSIRQLPE